MPADMQLFSKLVRAHPWHGIVPQTYCGPRVAEYCMEKSGREVIERSQADYLELHGDIAAALASFQD